MTDTKDKIQALIRDSSEEVQQVVAQVLRLEQDKLFLAKPRGIVEDITDLVRKIVT
jgi:hypothetical protein